MYSYEIDQYLSNKQYVLTYEEFDKIRYSSSQVIYIKRLYASNGVTVYEFGTNDNYNWEVRIPDMKVGEISEK